MPFLTSVDNLSLSLECTGRWTISELVEAVQSFNYSRCDLIFSSAPLLQVETPCSAEDAFTRSSVIGFSLEALKLKMNSRIFLPEGDARVHRRRMHFYVNVVKFLAPLSLEIAGDSSSINTSLLRLLIDASPPTQLVIEGGIPTKLLLFIDTPQTLVLLGDRQQKEGSSFFDDQLRDFCTHGVKKLVVMTKFTEASTALLLSLLSSSCDDPCTLKFVHLRGGATLPANTRDILLKSARYVHVLLRSDDDVHHHHRGEGGGDVCVLSMNEWYDEQRRIVARIYKENL